MIRFNNDYNHGAFASILKELGATNSTSYAGYGEDEWCDKAETIIKKLVDDDDALIKFIPGATQANYVVIAAALSSVQSVIAADTGTYQLSRGGVHREHRTQDSGTSEYRWQDYRAADRRLRQGVLRSGRAGVSDRTEDGISVFPDRKRYTLFEEGN